MKIGIAGTGMLGAAVALRLIRSGFEVAAYNRTPSKLMPIVDAGGDSAATPALLAADSDLVITIVRDAQAVADISFGEHGILGGMRPGSVAADMSTILPSESRRIHGRFADAGIEWLDTPVMGGPDAAAEGRLILMASGSAEAYGSVETVFAALAEKRHYLGDAGSAHSVKLAMNLQIAMLALSISEGICLSRHLGVAPDVFLDILNSTYFSTGMSRRKAHRMVRGQYPATFTLENLAKDLRTINQAAGDMSLPMAAEALRVYNGALDSGLGNLDYTGILEGIRPK